MRYNRDPLPTTQVISSAVWALTTLAFTLDAALLAATAKAARSGREWPSALSTRTVTSYCFGGTEIQTEIIARGLAGSGPRGGGMWPGP